MKSPSRRISAGPVLAAIGMIGLQLVSMHAQAQTPAQEAPVLPLTGPAFLIADAAYKAYANGNYALAIKQAREASRLRPDVRSLQDLLAKAEAAQSAQTRVKVQPDQSTRQDSTARASAPNKSRRPSTAPRPVMPEEQAASEAPVDPAPALAFQAADASYKAYDARNFALAESQAQEAVRLQPSNPDYRLLLINVLIAAGNYPLVEKALTDAGKLPGTDAAFAAQLTQRSVQLVQSKAQSAGASAYAKYDKGDFSAAASDAREAVRLTPANRDYQALLVSSLYRSNQFADAEVAASEALRLPVTASGTDSMQARAALLSQRGFIRQKLGLDSLAQQDFEQALGTGQLSASTEIGLLSDLGRKEDARKRFEAALAKGELKSLADAELAYLAVKTGQDEQALAAFNRSNAAGLLANTAYQDAAFSALRARHDDQAVGYFKRTIDDANALKLRLAPQLLFNTRRAVAEVSRQGGFIASLSYRGAVSGLGPAQGAASDSLQGGIEGYWRPWGYQNGQYAEVFVRAFQTLYSKDGASGGQTLQVAAGIRYKPISTQNLVFSFSRVLSPSGGRNDWLGQLGYSADSGTDLRVDVPSWWTRRASFEAGHYFSSSQNYALGELQAGKSFRLGDGNDVGSGRWAVFAHLSLAADYDSTALESSAVGVGPGVTARYWFREDTYAAPRSYVDFALHYRGRLSGSQRAKGLFLTTTVSY